MSKRVKLNNGIRFIAFSLFSNDSFEITRKRLLSMSCGLLKEKKIIWFDY